MKIIKNFIKILFFGKKKNDVANLISISDIFLFSTKSRSASKNFRVHGS